MSYIPLVWIETGRKLPHHLTNNILIHKEMYKDYDQYLVTDQKVPKSIAKICKIVDLRNFNLHSSSSLLSNDINRSTSQRAFWINTTKRFFVLESFLEALAIEKVIHLESDNLLLRGDIIQNMFSHPDWEMAFPLQAKEVGCASILLINKSKKLREFNEFVLKSWQEINQDDMSLLGKFSLNSGIKILPTWPNERYIFDPQTYGRFLFGTDARNNSKPYSQRGIVDDRVGAVNPTLLDFYWDSGIKNLVVSADKVNSVLVNIHIHSKRVPRSKAGLERMLTKDIASIRTVSWQRGVLDVRVFIERLLSWTMRRVFRKEIEFRLR
jgi:hypothetical protein